MNLFNAATSFIAISMAVAATAAADTTVWKITSLDAGTRANICSRQIQSCKNNCGGPDNAPMAFCNSTTMAWGCGCGDRKPDMPVWNWPVATADCRGSFDACKSNCNADKNNSSCYTKCSDTHKCNTEDAPVSYTRTSNRNEVPKYVGPAVSYKGDKLGDLNDGNDRSNLGDGISSKQEDDSGDGSGDNSSEDTTTSGAKINTRIGMTAALAVVAMLAAAF